MKIERAVIKRRFLSDQIIEILDSLSEERNLLVKGGIARTAILYYMKHGGKKVEKRLNIENNLNDIDVILLHSQSLARSKEYLIQREAELKEKLSEFTCKGIHFDGNIEPVRGSLSRDHREKILTKILRTRDLTINEVVLVYDNNWTAYFSKRFWRDLLCSVGMLTSGGWKTIRYDAGRMIPSNYGFYRLLKFWVEKKVKRIWLPQWMLRVHLNEMQRLRIKGLTAEGTSLGRYSRVIVNQYKNSSFRDRWMTALRHLGFTDLQSFEVFSKEQELLDELMNPEKFVFEKNIALSIDKLLEERRKKQAEREARKKQRKQCIHKFSVIECNGCDQGCRIKKCVHCDYVKKEKEFRCNEIVKTGDWCRDPSSLILFPRSKTASRSVPRTALSSFSSF